MTQVQARVPEKLVERLDEWVEEGRFKSRSDAVRTILAQYEETERTRGFLAMLEERSREARENPDDLVSL